MNAFMQPTVSKLPNFVLCASVQMSSGMERAEVLERFNDCMLRSFCIIPGIDM